MRLKIVIVALYGLTLLAAALLPSRLFAASEEAAPQDQRAIQLDIMGRRGLVLFGLAQKLFNAPAIFWQANDTGKTFFATYRYHSNAGSFINLVWPLMAGLLMTSIRRNQATATKLLWAIGLTFCLAGLAVTGARAAAVIALIFALIWIFRTVAHLRSGELPSISTPVAAGTIFDACVATAGSPAWRALTSIEAGANRETSCLLRGV